MASMSCTLSSFLLLSSILISSTAAFNITKLLEQNPDFATFNNYLSQTKLADEINRRQTITVLAVDNGAIGAVSGRPIDDVKDVLSLHVVLDYYDMEKLHKLSKKTALLTTLFQTTGLAIGQMGFLNVTNEKNGDILLGSAIPGSPLNAKVVKLVVSHPYNISVLQVSSVIIPQGIDNTNHTGAAAPPPPATTPAASPKKAPTPAASPKSSPPANAPASDATAPSPSDDGAAPTADAPAADAPAADAPAADAPEADAPAKAADSGPSADVPGPAADDKSSGSRVGFCGSVAVAMAMGVIAALASL